MAGIIEGKNTIEGTLGPLRSAGVPVAGTTAKQTLTFADTWADGDKFILSLDGNSTEAIAWSATNGTLVSNIDAALELLPQVGTGNVTTAVGTMTSGIGTITVTAAGTLVKAPMSDLVVADTTVDGDGTLASEVTTPGVWADFHGAAKGATLIDTTNSVLYQNTGTSSLAVWGKVGTQT